MSEMQKIQQGMRAPEPSVDRLEELANRILKGDILLPKFQRDFVWGKGQIVDLMDSIIKRYPVGSVLLWRSKEKLKSERNIADLQIATAPEDYPVNYLLDGQQRLSSVCGALYWNGSDPDSRWNIAYDLREKRFLHLESTDSPPLHQIRLNKISDPAAYFKHVSMLDSEKDHDLLRANAEELFNVFKDYKVSVVTLPEMSINDVAPIFERINSKGTPLTIVDLMRAATWSDGFDLVDAIDGILESLEEKGFGKIDKKAVLRSLSAASKGGFSEGSIDNLRKKTPEDLKAAAEAVKESYQAAVDFLSTEIHIPGDNYLPYVNQIVVLSEIFRQVKRPTAEQYAAIRRWFWRTASSGYFGGWNTGNMGADKDAVNNFSAGATYEIISAAVKPSEKLWGTTQFRTNTANTRILVALLAYNKPIDLLTGQKIDADKALLRANGKEFHHFFPKDYLKSAKGIDVKKSSVLANFVMLTAASNKVISNRAPSDYLRDVEFALGGRLEGALAANLISNEAYDAAKRDDFEGFLAARSKTIHEVVCGLAEW